jgi:putative two-component system response regulator
VVDVWDALTSDRAYRSAWSADRALRHLVAGRASHFDPVCLDAFMA